MVKVKICGLSRDCDIDAVNELKPDYIGLVFAPSRRRVTPGQAAWLRMRLSPDIIPVGIFVNEPIDNIISLVNDGIIDIIQLHGDENEDYIRQLKKRTDKPVIKAVAVHNKNDALKWSDSVADYLLLDNIIAGSGETFDWDLIGEISKPFFLAGGLCPENVARAIAKTKPFAVDTSSGVETSGFKDKAKIKDFVIRARNAKICQEDIK